MELTTKLKRRLPRTFFFCLILLLAMNAFASDQAPVLPNPPADPSNMLDPKNHVEAIIEEPIAPPISDPYQRINRFFFNLNDTLDTMILKPLATLYNAIMPRPLNRGIHNAFVNINNIPTIANDLLQVHFYQAASDTWRLLINTSIGVGGLFDVANTLGLEPYTNDFGLTLATWGYRHSDFIVLPIFGLNTIRDGLALPVDYFGFSIYPYIHADTDTIGYGLYGLSVIDRRAQLLKYQSLLEEISLDKYAFVRNAYIQRRQHQIEVNDQLGVGCKERQPPSIKENVPAGVNIGT